MSTNRNAMLIAIGDGLFIGGAATSAVGTVEAAAKRPLDALLRKELENGHLIKNAPEEMRHDSAYFGNPTTTKELINSDVY